MLPVSVYKESPVAPSALTFITNLLSFDAAMKSPASDMVGATVLAIPNNSPRFAVPPCVTTMFSCVDVEFFPFLSIIVAVAFKVTDWFEASVPVTSNSILALLVMVFPVPAPFTNVKTSFASTVESFVNAVCVTAI